MIKLKRLTIELDEETIHIFKMVALMQKKTMKQVIEESIKKYIEANKKIQSGGMTLSEVVK